MPTSAQTTAAQLRVVSMVLSRQFRAALRRQGLSHASMSVLAELRRGGDMSPTELARREGVKPQTLTRLLAELQAQGWIERRPNAADARQSLVALSPQGRERLHSAVASAEDALARVLQQHTSAPDLALLQQACTVLERVCDLVWEQGSGGAW
ncbi:MAG: MarR family winged helix-turn-helix transcriptional regulator [Rhodoferax sp.]